MGSNSDIMEHESDPKVRVLYNGTRLPCIGYGTFPLKEKLSTTVPAAIRTGYELVDTSDNYLNEKFVGEGLKNANYPSSVVVQTKFSQPLRTKRLDRCFDESESKLGGRIDVYLIHWPYPFLWRIQWKKMEKLYLAGRCKAIGVCNFKKKHLRSLFSFCKVKPMINQIERHPLYQQRAAVEFSEAHGIQVMSYSPLARMDKRLMENPVLGEIAQAHGKTVSQVILRWNIEHGHIPIPASGSEEHIRGNFDVFDFSLSQEEVKRIDALESGTRVRYDPDTRFGWRMKLRFLWCRIKLIGKRI